MIKKLRAFSNLNYIAIATWTVAIILTSIYLVDNLVGENLGNEGDVNLSKAAIIDQLHDDLPNLYYQENVRRYLEDGGYQVDLYTTKDITVDFYKNLPSMNYEFIVIRTHSLREGSVGPSSSLFTGEHYTEEKYIREQLFGQVGKGVPYLPQQVEEVGWSALSNQTYFVLGSKHIDDLMSGSFPSSVIIMGGCDTLSGPLLSKSLIKRGASSVVGWDGLISASDNDKAILALLKEIFVNKEEINNAVELVMQNFESHTEYSPVLKYYS